MSRGTDAERIPLLRNNPTRKNNCCSYYLRSGFKILAALLLSIIICFYFIELNEETLTKTTTKIPYDYYLGLKSNNVIGFDRFEYVIEIPSPSDSKLFVKNLNSTFTEDIPHDRLKIAEIVAKSYKAWKPAYYEVREENSYNNSTVLTTQSHMSGLWFIIWPPKVYVSFSLDDDNNENNKDTDDGRRGNKFIKIDDYKNLLKCVYEISWNYKYFGEIYRKCPNQKDWVKISYVKGSSEWGMQWLCPERTETYGIVTKPAKNRQMRNVVVRPDSPFPPILPALYVAYFDRVIG